jgi:hypothetical protein
MHLSELSQRPLACRSNGQKRPATDCFTGVSVLHDKALDPPRYQETKATKLSVPDKLLETVALRLRCLYKGLCFLVASLSSESTSLDLDLQEALFA